MQLHNEEINKIKEVEDFIVWFDGSKPNDKYTYFWGESLTYTVISTKLQELTYDYACKGLLYLVRKKEGLNNYKYIAIKASKPPNYRLVPDKEIKTSAKPKIESGRIYRHDQSLHLTVAGLN